jgi:CBS domain-containing protein
MKVTSLESIRNPISTDGLYPTNKIFSPCNFARSIATVLLFHPRGRVHMHTIDHQLIIVDGLPLHHAESPREATVGSAVPELGAPNIAHNSSEVAMDVQLSAEVMNTKVHTCSAGLPLPAAASLLHERSTQRLFVLDEARRPVGVLTRGDVVRALAAEG